MPTKQNSDQVIMIQLRCSLIILLLLSCSLNLSAGQIPKLKDKDQKEEIVRGYLRQSGAQLSFDIISSQLPVNELWMHRVESISPKISVRISDNGKQLLLNTKSKLPTVVKVKVRSYVVRKRDLKLTLSQIQTIGTHNSYHIAPHSSVMKLIRSVMPSQADGISYTHRPLSEQLNLLGMRKFELDLFHDTKGGAYSSPAGAVMANGSNWKTKHPEFDEEAMSKQE